MFRSLVSLLLLANMTAGTMVSTNDVISSYNNVDFLEVSPIPQKYYGDIQPVIEAKSALIMDLDSGIILYEKDAYVPLPMASLTKIMTAILILESHNLSEVVTIDENYGAMPESETGVKIWLRNGEKITVGNLLIGLLVPSGGDAALALAKYHSGSVETFVNDMNERARMLNLKNTHFMNPIGLDADEHYSSVFDLALLTKHALNFPSFRNIVRMKSATIASTNDKIKHSFETTNWLLGSYLDIQGVKTGTTDEAGASLINLARNDYGHEIISVLLNSPNRFQENKSLIDWTFRTYNW
ncbi:D-alanyl-D-alanine carboxypeptidase [Patescibacteria group bacterium]|nr:D-alanyl-D-alanine carboxypeptidase [Patescibacteria group bacterium]